MRAQRGARQSTPTMLNSVLLLPRLRERVTERRCRENMRFPPPKVVRPPRFERGTLCSKSAIVRSNRGHRVSSKGRCSVGKKSGCSSVEIGSVTWACGW